VIDALRNAVREVRRELPFAIDGWAVLLDRMHAVWTLPEVETGLWKAVGA
jgi:REP element-mobilizing transposase RayT